MEYERNPEYDSILKEWVERHPRSYFKKLKASKNRKILEYVEKMTPKLSDGKYLVSTKVFWVLNGLSDFPKCRICGKPLLQNVGATEGYPTHCSAKCLSDDPEVLKRKNESFERRYGEGITNPFQSEDVKRQIDRTNLERYGTKRYTQTKSYRMRVSSMHDEIEAKKKRTHFANSSFCDSKPETVAFNILRRKFPDLVRQYSSVEYPYSCDFFSKSENLYMEFNGTWTHGGHPFNPVDENDVKTLDEWRRKAEKNDYYRNAIYTWTELDPRKMDTARKNGINLKVFWSLEDVYDFTIPNYDDIVHVDELVVKYDRKRLSRELEFYRNANADMFNGAPSSRNEIVKFFQQDMFFRKEREIWKNDPEKRGKLIENRMKYLRKDVSELTHLDILNGFKRSGIHYGYSHFNPLWFKWFIRKFGTKTCYDPCGGWGHRLLGGLSLEKYIYNDLSRTVKSNVDEIVKFFRLKNVSTHCEDARTFRPDEDFDSMFTCPPYFNVEKYECGGFRNMDDYLLFIDSLFSVFRERESCSVFGLVVREDLLGDHLDYSERHEVNTCGEKYLSSTEKRLREYLYVFKK